MLILSKVRAVFRCKTSSIYLTQVCIPLTEYCFSSLPPRPFYAPCLPLIDLVLAPTGSRRDRAVGVLPHLSQEAEVFLYILIHAIHT